jgi:anthranilate synthase component 2
MTACPPARAVTRTRAHPSDRQLRQLHWNLVHQLAELGVASEVVRNDALSAEEALRAAPARSSSRPGPCARPGRRLPGAARRARRRPAHPGRLPGPSGRGSGLRRPGGPRQDLMHGKTSPSATAARRLRWPPRTASPPRATTASACERDSLPTRWRSPPGLTTARVMGLSHRDRPCTASSSTPSPSPPHPGRDLLANFLEAGTAFAGSESRRRRMRRAGAEPPAAETGCGAARGGRSRTPPLPPGRAVPSRSTGGVHARRDSWAYSMSEPSNPAGPARRRRDPVRRRRGPLLLRLPARRDHARPRSARP